MVPRVVGRAAFRLISEKTVSLPSFFCLSHSPSHCSCDFLSHTPRRNGKFWSRPSYHSETGNGGYRGFKSRVFSTLPSRTASSPSSPPTTSSLSSDEVDGMSLFGFNVTDDSSSSSSVRRRFEDAAMSSESGSSSGRVPRTEEETTQLEHELISYFQTCIFNGDLRQAENVLRTFDEYKTPSMFHIFLRTYLKENDLNRFVETLELTRTENVEAQVLTFALTLAAYGHCLESKERYSSSGASDNISDAPEIRTILSDAISEMSTSLKVAIDDTFKDCALLQEEKRLITVAVAKLHESASPVSPSTPLLDYDCPIVDHLNEPRESYPNPFFGAIDVAEAIIRLRDIWRKEISGLIFTDRVDDAEIRSRNESSKRPASPILDLHRQIWRKSIGEALECHLNVMKKKRFDENKVSIYPYLKMFTLEELTDFLTDEIDQIILWTKPMAFPNHVHAARIGRILAIRSVAKQHRIFGDFEAFETVYSRYLEFYAAEKREFPTERHFWESMRGEFSFLADMDVSLHYWPQSVRVQIGLLLLHIIVGEALFNPSLLDSDKGGGEFIPVFYIGKKNVRPNVDVYRLYELGSPVRQSFPSTELPTQLPPMPWINQSVNGSVLSDTAVIRFDRDDKYAYETLASIDQRRLYPPLDALNHLSSCPWRVNDFILDVASEVFKSGGSPDVGIPQTHSVESSRFRHPLDHATVTNNKNWFSALNNLSIAEEMRGRVFWHPHHMDYRGRCTTVPAFLSHHGPDLVRGLITFGNGKPLGERGLDWLKIHAINVAGLKKRDSLDERVKYANEILEDILDSAHNPLNGAGWWKKGDKPWETLAACKEISNALSSSSPESFLSRLPVHQDGSCNSLQHVCALTRDQAAGELVNLGPSERPNDPYSDIIELLEKKRCSDARKGRQEAQVLEGFLERVVVKRIIMRVGYGASRDSAIGYVEQWLQEMEQFPKRHVRKCSQYLGLAILDCNARMFKSSEMLRRWLYKLAEMVTLENGSIVLWKSVLGLPIHQPPVPHIFVPNFIHSLDACHMMLTAMHAHHSGVTFCAVHDCFWTHAGTVDAMNSICRQEFHRLHTSGLLEDLLDQCSRLAVVDDELPPIPRRGTLDIDKVLESTYLFQ